MYSSGPQYLNLINHPYTLSTQIFWPHIQNGIDNYTIYRIIVKLLPIQTIHTKTVANILLPITHNLSLHLLTSWPLALYRGIFLIRLWNSYKKHIQLVISEHIKVGQNLLPPQFVVAEPPPSTYNTYKCPSHYGHAWHLTRVRSHLTHWGLRKPCHSWCLKKNSYNFERRRIYR